MKIKKGISLAALIAGSLNLSAQNNTQVNTIEMKNLTEGVNEIKFKAHGNHDLAAHLYTPVGFDATRTYPTVLFSGPFNQVKEQTGAIYGEKLADKGYVVLVFDHLGYGESQGEIRNYENPNTKMESIRDAVSFLNTLPYVNSEKLFGLGVCASGGYMPIVATTDKRIKAVVTVSGMMNNSAAYFGVMSKEQIAPLFKMANDARQKAYETGVVDYYDALGMESVDTASIDKESAMYEGYDYYMTKRAGVQTYSNYSHTAPAYLMEQAPISNAVAIAPFLNTPYLGVYGSKAETGPLTQMFFDAASEPKELYVVEGATHVSLYDINTDVDKAIEKMIEFFNNL